MTNKIRKGDFLLVKAPPYYRDEYCYEVISAGEKVIRAALQHSSKVRKSWTLDELNLLMKIGVVRLADPEENPSVS